MEEHAHGLLARHTKERKRDGTPGVVFPKSFNLNDLSGRNVHKATEAKLRQ